MGMLPIDLQTLYTQLDKIGKSQIQQQLAAQAVQESQIAANKKKAELKLKSVQELDLGKENVGSIHDQEADNVTSDSENQHNSPDTATEDAVPQKEREIITDPALGAHIDISG